MLLADEPHANGIGGGIRKLRQHSQAWGCVSAILLLQLIKASYRRYPLNPGSDTTPIYPCDRVILQLQLTQTAFCPPSIFISTSQWTPRAALLLDTVYKMDSSQAPLISNESREEELEYEADDGLDSASVASKASDGKPSVFVLVLTFTAGISGLLFGCKLCSSLL